MLGIIALHTYSRQKVKLSNRRTLEHFGIQRSSWSIQWLRGAQVLWLQNKTKSAPHHHPAIGWGIRLICCVWLMRCILAKHLHVGFVYQKDICLRARSHFLQTLQINDTSSGFSNSTCMKFNIYHADWGLWTLRCSSWVFGTLSVGQPDFVGWICWEDWQLSQTFSTCE